MTGLPLPKRPEKAVGTPQSPCSTVKPNCSSASQ